MAKATTYSAPRKNKNGASSRVLGKKPKTGAATSGKKSAGKKRPAIEIWNLRLYVAGQSPRSMAAFTNLKRICDQHLAGRYRIEVFDLEKNPNLARSDQIFAIPTLIRQLPEPLRRIIGDLSDIERTMVGLDLVPTRP